MGELFKLDNQATLIEEIKANNSITLKTIYRLNYPKVELLVLNNNGTKEHAKDIYQEAFIVTWNNIKNNHFIPQNESAIEGYLYTIAKNKWLDFLRSKQFKKTVYSVDFLLNKIETDMEITNEDFLKDERLKKVMKAFETLGDPCKKLLTAFYFDKISINSIANNIKLNSASARNKKYRCMQRLRDLALNTKIQDE